MTYLALTTETVAEGPRRDLCALPMAGGRGVNAPLLLLSVLVPYPADGFRSALGRCAVREDQDVASWSRAGSRSLRVPPVALIDDAFKPLAPLGSYLAEVRP